MDNDMEICCEHGLITSIGQQFGPVDFSDLSLVITLQTMEGEIAISSSWGVSSFDSRSSVGMLVKFSWVNTLEEYEFSNSAFSWLKEARDPSRRCIASILGLALRLEFT